MILYWTSIDNIFIGVGGTFRQKPANIQDRYQKQYQKKLEYRCQYQLTQAVAVCIEAFSLAYDTCYAKAPGHTAWLLCWPLKLNYVCNFLQLIQSNDTCDSSKQVGTYIIYVDKCTIYI